MKKHQVTKDTRLLHGGDYNPDQWLDCPGIIDQDFKLMKQAHTNTFSVGMFSWASLEPEEGVYTFEWLDDIFDRIEAMGGNMILATPSGARPAWMSQKYPEVLRVDALRRKQLHGARHNHCFTSPYYREKAQEMNRKLAERYGKRSSLLMWHISNEYGGECHCDLCQTAFRDWLKVQYDNDLDKVNQSWWGPFWSHTFTNWEQIESPSPIGENAVHGLNLDWRRFVTDQTISFYKDEIVPLRELTPEVPITTNFMSDNPSFTPFRALDYSKFAKEVDVISWDAYPAWHNDYEETYELASKVGFMNDSFKSMKQKPWLLMESTPSHVNWHQFNKAKRPSMHYLSAMQMLAHGSDSNLYFQWRKSRGSSEKFHGAVVDHDGSTENRVFKEVARLGKAMEDLSEKVVGSQRIAEVGLLYDWDSDWALEHTQGFGLQTKLYPETLQKHYQSLWEKDIPVDVITKENTFKDYKLLVVPMLYLMSEETVQRLKVYVANGGTLVSSYITGLVNEHDLTYLGGWKKELQEVFGIEPLETDTYYTSDSNELTFNNKQYAIRDYATIIDVKEAEVLAQYEGDFYADSAAVTLNNYKDGEAYYIGARAEDDFNRDFYSHLIEKLDLSPGLKVEHEIGVSVQGRILDDGTSIIFIMNFTEEEQAIEILEDVRDSFTGETLSGDVSLKPYEVLVVDKNN
ncbi:beta-galactosidase [Marinilactibacillus sp. XAAS-LB27]|uniref:beta-galactosidase n=1 Tax=Marinilactibacillus sp. XAAS-LB27 TaxID=3114538 RepID=UPI002E17445A|nr:beta-galactosidase [Marinilactibacillus sp. XAAS-LB27]